MPRKKKTMAEDPAAPVMLPSNENEVTEMLSPTVEDDLPEGPEMLPEVAKSPVPEIIPPEGLSASNRNRYLSSESYRELVDKMLPKYRNFGKAWTDEEREKLRELYTSKATDDELVSAFGRTIKGIYLELIKMREMRLAADAPAVL